LSSPTKISYNISPFKAELLTLSFEVEVEVCAIEKALVSASDRKTGVNKNFMLAS
jgi:hypothetical protein